MRRFWYDAERDRYYRLDREHRAAARAAAAAERARAAREHAAQPCAAPLHVHAPSALLAAQLAPRPGAAAAALRACAVRTCASTPSPAPVGALLPRAPLARRTFRTPLVALGPAPSPRGVQASPAPLSTAPQVPQTHCTLAQARCVPCTRLVRPGTSSSSPLPRVTPSSLPSTTAPTTPSPSSATPSQEDT